MHFFCFTSNYATIKILPSILQVTRRYWRTSTVRSAFCCSSTFCFSSPPPGNWRAASGKASSWKARPNGESDTQKDFTNSSYIVILNLDRANERCQRRIHYFSSEPASSISTLGVNASIRLVTPFLADNCYRTSSPRSYRQLILTIRTRAQLSGALNLKIYRTAQIARPHTNIFTYQSWEKYSRILKIQNTKYYVYSKCIDKYLSTSNW